MSTIVTYANNSPHEQHYFRQPSELIGRSPEDPLLQIDNIKLAERHLNALFIQFYFVDVERPPQDATNVFQSLGLTEEFFNLSSTDAHHYPRFRQWLENLESGDRHYDMAIELLPIELEERLTEIFGDNWRIDFINQRIVQFLSDLDEHAQFFTQLRAGEDWEPAGHNSLIDFLLRNAYLPSFAFPLDVCTFAVLRGDEGRWREVYKPSTDMKQALSMYVPGRTIVVDKKKYQSASLYVPFPTDYHNPFRGEIGQISRWSLLCEECGGLTVYYSEPDEDIAQCPCIIDNEPCGAWNQINPVYTPKGFAPQIKTSGSDEKSTSHIQTRDEERKHSLSDIMIPITRTFDQEHGEDFGDNSELLLLQDEIFYHINRGDIKSVTDNSDEERTIHARGWDFCRDCGLSRDVITRQGQHAKAYPRFTRNVRIGGEVERITYQNTCNCTDSIRLFLGYEFQTDAVMLRVPLNPSEINCDDMGQNGPIHRGAISAKEALLAAIFRGGIVGLDLDPNEIDGHYRIIWSENNMQWVLEIFLYDNASGGAGFASRIAENFDHVIDQAIDMMIESCDCPSSCHLCLRSFENRFEHNNLNRFAAADCCNTLLMAANRKSKRLEPGVCWTTTWLQC